MYKKTRVITTSALLTAFSIATLYIAAVWPTGRFGLVASASLFVASAVIEMGPAQGACVFFAASSLGMIILPDKSPPTLFILFFGYYPILKCLFERLGRIAFQWVAKFCVFNAALSVMWFFLRNLLPDIVRDEAGAVAAVVFLGGNAVFAVYDYGYSKLIRFYIGNVSKYIKKG